MESLIESFIASTADDRRGRLREFGEGKWKCGSWHDAEVSRQSAVVRSTTGPGGYNRSPPIA